MSTNLIGLNLVLAVVYNEYADSLKARVVSFFRLRAEGVSAAPPILLLLPLLLLLVARGECGPAARPPEHGQMKNFPLWERLGRYVDVGVRVHSACQCGTLAGAPPG